MLKAVKLIVVTGVLAMGLFSLLGCTTGTNGSSSASAASESGATANASASGAASGADPSTSAPGADASPDASDPSAASSSAADPDQTASGNSSPADFGLGPSSSSSNSRAGAGADPSASRASASSPSPDEGQTYAIECSRRIAGGERYVSLSAEGVVCYEHGTREDPSDGDGMADYLDVYTFAPLAPGMVYVRIVDVLPWMDREGVEDQFRLVVDDDLNIAREEIPNVERFELREYRDTADCLVYAAEPGDAGFLHASIYWEDFDGYRWEERSLNVRPDEATAALMDAHVYAWDGFHESDPDALDGTSFTFEATFDDGSTISASGTNAFPEGYPVFGQAIGELIGLA